LLLLVGSYGQHLGVLCRCSFLSGTAPFSDHGLTAHPGRNNAGPPQTAAVHQLVDHVKFAPQLRPALLERPINNTLFFVGTANARHGC
jgi:hypothetical protein